MLGCWAGQDRHASGSTWAHLYINAESHVKPDGKRECAGLLLFFSFPVIIGSFEPFMGAARLQQSGASSEGGTADKKRLRDVCVCVCVGLKREFEVRRVIPFFSIVS